MLRSIRGFILFLKCVQPCCILLRIPALRKLFLFNLHEKDVDFPNSCHDLHTSIPPAFDVRTAACFRQMSAPPGFGARVKALKTLDSQLHLDRLGGYGPRASQFSYGSLLLQGLFEVIADSATTSLWRIMLRLQCPLLQRLQSEVRASPAPNVSGNGALRRRKPCLRT